MYDYITYFYMYFIQFHQTHSENKEVIECRVV